MTFEPPMKSLESSSDEKTNSAVWEKSLPLQHADDCESSPYKVNKESVKPDFYMKCIAVFEKAITTLGFTWHRVHPGEEKIPCRV